MKQKLFKQKGEIAFRMWIFASAIEALGKTPNSEKLEILKTKMDAFFPTVCEYGTDEQKQDWDQLTVNFVEVSLKHS